MTTDPVCGMKVDNQRPVLAYEYKGKIYYFCAVGCRDEFSYDPEKFIKEGNGKWIRNFLIRIFGGKGGDESKFGFNAK